jgi:phage FluMu protein Com
MIHVNLICRFCGTKYDDSYEFSEHYYGTVCPECRAIDEPRMKKETAQIKEEGNG